MVSEVIERGTHGRSEGAIMYLYSMDSLEVLWSVKL